MSEDKSGSDEAVSLTPSSDTDNSSGAEEDDD